MHNNNNKSLAEILKVVAAQYRALGASIEDFEVATREAFEAAASSAPALLEFASADIRPADLARVRQIAEPKLLAAHRDTAALLQACANLGEPDDERVTVTTAILFGHKP